MQLKHSISHLVISILSSRYWNRYLWNELSIIKHDVKYWRSFFFMFEVGTFQRDDKTRQRILKFISIFKNQLGNEMVEIFSLDAVVKCWHCDEMLTPLQNVDFVLWKACYPRQKVSNVSRLKGKAKTGLHGLPMCFVVASHYQSLQIIVLLLQACLLDIYLFCRIWSEDF